MIEQDASALARLHLACLPDSMVSALGARFARSFYRYVASSPRELLLEERGEQGEIIAACVLSLDPESLNLRLLLSTPLAFFALLRIAPLLSRLLHAPGPRSQEPGDSMEDLPELILIFSSADSRSRGLGSLLVERLEDRLIERRVRRYRVKTEADPANRALGFYDRLGFRRSHVEAKQGRLFQVFTKDLASV